MITRAGMWSASLRCATFIPRLAGVAFLFALVGAASGELFPKALPSVVVATCRAFVVGTSVVVVVVPVGLLTLAIMLPKLSWLFALLEQRRVKHEAARLRREADVRESLKMIVQEVARSGPNVLTADEVEKARQLADSGDENAVKLACVAVSATGCQPADLAAVFTPHVLKRISESSPPACWPDVAQAIHPVAPCLDLLRLYLIDRLRRVSIDAWTHTGFMDHVVPKPDRHKPFQVLLEDHFPRDFITALAPAIRPGISGRVLNMNMIASYYVYSFPFEVLTTLSTEGARILAELPDQGQDSLQPFWEPYGQHLALARLATLSDEAAGALSAARRGILFGDLRSFPDTPGHVKLAKRLARQRHVVLGPSTQLAPAVAEILSSVTISPPATLREILYCDMTTVQGRNRAIFVAADVPNILR